MFIYTCFEKMCWLNIFVFFNYVALGLSINRPVYKAVLTQKGYAQFLQYDIETPPIREFTFCTWFRIYELLGDQTLFTYVGVHPRTNAKITVDDVVLEPVNEIVYSGCAKAGIGANGNNRVIRLWLDSSGKSINLSINGKVSSSSTVDIPKDVWRHVCLSYQADYGAWALYMDSRLISCQSSQSIQGFVLPDSGSVIIGYGTDINGAQNGLQGEIFGANMILISTIERNYTIKINPTYEQKPFHRNRMKGGELHPNYVILNDLQSDEINNSFETTQKPITSTSNKSFIKFRTPHSFIEHEVGLNSNTKEGSTHPYIKDILPYSESDKVTESYNSNAWNLNTEAHIGKYRIRNKNKSDQHNTNSEQLPVLPEHEVPPPISESIYNIYEDTTDRKNIFNTMNSNNLSEVELPPPLSKESKVYGQWTSSKFAGSVLNYLKNQQTYLREQKRIMTPQTIPLIKNSDSFPYASDFKIMKIRPPYQYQRRNLVERHQFENKRTPQYNVQVLEDDLRHNIIKSHAQTVVKNVEISNRGMAKRRQEHRFYRNIENQDESQENYKNKHSTKTLQSTTSKINKAAELNLQSQDLMTILPFLKSLEYFIEDSPNTYAGDSTKNNSDAYTRSLSLGNKWHNVKSYSNDYTPREFKIGFSEHQTSLDEKIAQINKRHPAIRLKYKHENRKVVQYKDDETILKGRALAMAVSNTSDYNKDAVSIFKYNHGFLPTKSHKVGDKIKGKYEQRNNSNKNPASIRNSFNKQVKIGNALNERPIIGYSVHQNKKSFVGGDERIPDIQKHRSNTNNDEYVNSVPGSLGPRICKNLELYDRVLYVQPDESIDMSHILSPVKMKNIGIEFIMQNYKKCSLEESPIQNNAMLFIDWNKTPVRLFGGAYARRTTDLCGFF